MVVLSFVPEDGLDDDDDDEERVGGVRGRGGYLRGDGSMLWVGLLGDSSLCIG